MHYSSSIRSILLALKSATVLLLLLSSSQPTSAAQHYALQQVLRPSDSENGDLFGGSVDLDGDTLIVRSRVEYANEDLIPQTHVFEAKANGTWSETAIIIPSTLPDGRVLLRGGILSFGQEAALDRGSIVHGQSFGYGIAQVYATTFANRMPEGWTSDLIRYDAQERTRIRSSYLSSSAPFMNRTVAISNDIAIAGDPLGNARDAGSDAHNTIGVVHVFEQTESQAWRWGGLITPNISVVDYWKTMTWFGHSVAIDGHTVAVLDRNLQNSSPQGIHFFDRDDTSVWHQTDSIVLDDGTNPDTQYTAIDVELSGNNALVRGYGLESEAIILTRSNPLGSGEKLGWEVATRIAGGTAAVGETATIEDDLAAITVFSNGRNEIHIYRQDQDSVWNLFDTIVSPEPSYNSTFGTSLAFDNNRLLVGAPGQSNSVVGEGEFPLPGSAFIFVLVPEPTTASQAFALVVGLLATRRRR